MPASFHTFNITNSHLVISKYVTTTSGSRKSNIISWSCKYISNLRLKVLVLLATTIQEVVHDLSTSASFNDLEWPLTQISRLRHYSTLNIAKNASNALNVPSTDQKETSSVYDENSLSTVSYSYSIATIAVSLAVSTQYTNVTDARNTTAWQHRLHLCIVLRGEK